MRSTRFLLLFLIVYLTFFEAFLVLADNNSAAFQQGSMYQNQNQLGNPDAKDNINNFSNRNADSSHLQNLNNGDLENKGSDVLRNSDFGQLLQDSDEKKINAIEEHKLNADNKLIKDAAVIENDPMAATGGGKLGYSEKTTTEQINTSCTEGVEFDVDVIQELNLEVEEENYLGPLKREPRTVDINGGRIYHGARHLGYSEKQYKKRHHWYIHQNSHGWRIFLSKHLNIPLENIDNGISFPFGRNGVGGMSPVGDAWRWVWDNYRFKYTYISQEKLQRLVEKGESWQVVNEFAEQMVESNECYEKERVCLKSGVKVFLGKYEVTRPCWQQKIIYHCQSEPKNGCERLIKEDCQLGESECEHKIGQLCLRWKRNYLCAGKQQKELNFAAADSDMYCLGGDCYSPIIIPNNNFSNVGYLAALNEANKDCTKENGVCVNPITVFPGKSEGCKKIIGSVINCCASMKGWAKGIFCECSGEEKGLALKRDKGLCHRVGTYCHDKILGKCTVKKTKYCCFSSKLARVFHEQGRAQLGIGWGSSENPDCRPLTLEELSRIDFSKFNMDELFDSLLSKGKGNANKNITNIIPKVTPGKLPEMPKIQQEGMSNTTQSQQSL
ncbi:MAG: conjugal transfer protein TraN [Rickettsiaceae bacterium]|nr:conjugal transfer protein TraN [Rickettsiaceae bacterium]